MSAHLDHIGMGAPINGDAIYNGAMDNASGVASLLDIAEMLHETKARPKRSILFVAVTGEEKGLAGFAVLCQSSDGTGETNCGGLEFRYVPAAGAFETFDRLWSG